ncbi:MAG: azurin [Pseudomonadota bacterium]
MKNRFKFCVALCLAVLAVNTASADECKLTINSNDAMQFDQSEMVAPANCETITIVLNHTGSLAANAMGHNWVLTTAANFQDVANAGLGAGLDNNYVPVDDDRVLASTKVIGGGESTEVTFAASILSADEEYLFFCSFPGHWAIMKGVFKAAS